MVKTKFVERKELNPFADERTCRNGGGYFQPEWHVAFEDGVEIVVWDTSCGEFGSRIDAAMYFKGRIVADASWGSMCGRETSSTFRDVQHRPWTEKVYEEIGYDIPILCD